MTLHHLISSISLYFVDHWQGIKDFFNSVFFTAIAGAFAGAYAGARIAQVIAERAKTRENMMAEIRNTNAASMMAFTIFSSLVSLRSQHVKRLKEQHDEQKAALLAAINLRRQGQIIEFHYVADLQTLSLYQLPVDALQKHVFEKISTQGRPMALVITLAQTVQSLHASIQARNDLIAFYKASNLSDNERIGLIFGMPTGNGQIINNDYPSTLDAIYSYTSDSIYFAWKLSGDLVEHGNEVAEAFRNKFDEEPPPVSKADYAIAIKGGHIPDAKDYESWDTMFVKAPAVVKRTCIQKLIARFKRKAAGPK